MARWSILWGCGLLLLFTQCYAQTPAIKRRADSFFGVHFDFHASTTDQNIGGTLTPAMVTGFLSEVKPDFIQVDTKGHPGIASYPTRVGVAAPGIVKDPLRIFRDATKRMGVGLYSHFSGVIDAAACHNHPDWARVNANGATDGSATSLFGPYCDTYFIKQIEELSTNYGIDGVWVDGDCWGVQADFSANAKRAFNSATGGQAALNNDYMNFTRQAFHKYLAHYTAVLHRFNPNLQIASNWAYSTYMPGPVDAGVDFLSGDVVNDEVKNMTIEPRVLSVQGKPWDLMVWGFMGDKNGQGHYWKSARQLEQKAAIVISQGGGFQVYINQNRDASIPVETAPTLKQVADFCYAHKPYSFKSTPIPQIAMLLSAEGHDYDLGTATAFDQNNGGNNNIKGTLAMLLNSKYPVQVLQEHNLKGNLSKYPLLVITEWNYLPPAFISEVTSYVNNGGKLLLVGGATCGIFKGLLAGAPASTANPSKLPILQKNYGKGMVIGVFANISLQYFNTGDDNLRQTIAAQVQQLFPNPMVTVTGATGVHVVLNALHGNTMIHLINTNDHWATVGNTPQLEFQLPAAGALTVTLRTNRKPRQITLQPTHTTVQFTYANGIARFNVPGVDIYSIAEVKY